jgi:hypothetical protein
VRSRAEHFLIAQSFVSGLRPRGRAQSARVPESDGTTARAVCRTLGIRSHRCLHACWRGRSMGQIFDHREAAARVSRLPRTVCESAGERWRDGAGSLPDLGYPVTPMLACMLAWAVDRTDFRPSRSGGASEPAAAHSLRECGRAVARRRGQFAGPSVSGHTDACTQIGAGGRRNRFSSIEKRRRECTGCRARYGGVAESDGATGQAVCRTSRFRPPRSLHAYWCGRATRPIFDHRETGLAVLARAGARCGRVAESDGATGQAVTGPWDSGRPDACMHAYWCGRATRPIFDHR